MSMAVTPSPPSTPAVPLDKLVADARRANTECSAASLEDLLKNLAEACARIEASLESTRARAAEAREACAVEENTLKGVEDGIAAVQKARLDALEGLRGLTKSQANEVKALKSRPPPAARRATEAVYTVLRCDRWRQTGPATMKNLDFAKEWVNIQKMLSNNDFVQSVLSFDIAALESAPHVAEFVAARYFPTLLLTHGSIATAQSDGRGAIEAASSSVPDAAAPKEERRSGRASRRMPTVQSERNSVQHASTPRNAGGASMAAAKLLQGGARRSTATGSVAPVTETLDLDAVEYASHACGALARWVHEVLREFFVLRELRQRRDLAQSRLAVATTNLNEAAATEARLTEELTLVKTELANGYARLDELCLREVEVHRAQARLSQLAQLERRYSSRTAAGEDGPSPFGWGRVQDGPERDDFLLGRSPTMPLMPRLGLSLGDSEIGLDHEQREKEDPENPMLPRLSEAELRAAAIKAKSFASLPSVGDGWASGRPAPLRRRVINPADEDVGGTNVNTKQPRLECLGHCPQMAPTPSTTSWPPPRRKYLHVMSTASPSSDDEV